MRGTVPDTAGGWAIYLGWGDYIIPDDEDGVGAGQSFKKKWIQRRKGVWSGRQ